MNLPLKEQLKVWKKDYQEVRKKPKITSKEVLSESDIKSLMGVDKPVYRRHRGAFRQR